MKMPMGMKRASAIYANQLALCTLNTETNPAVHVCGIAVGDNPSRFVEVAPRLEPSKAARAENSLMRVREATSDRAHTSPRLRHSGTYWMNRTIRR